MTDSSGKKLYTLNRGDLPLVNSRTTAASAVRLMQKHGKKAVLVKQKNRRVSLLLDTHIGDYLVDHTRATPKTTLARIASEHRAIPYARGNESVSAALEGHPERVSTSSKQANQLFFQSETSITYISSAPIMYVCVEYRHEYAPPPPQKCRLDGSPLQPA